MSTLNDVLGHYQNWTEDMEIRLTRKNGWNDITDAYYGKLPSDWPFISQTTDPRIRTTLIEKNARLINSKLRGRLVPREGSDVVSATINNALLDFQWDNANDGGPMILKLSIADMDTRLYGSKFALIKWKTIYDEDNNILFDGNEMEPLDIRDCGIDYAATHIRNAKWFQVRTWEYVEDLERETDVTGKRIFKNMGELKRLIKENKPKGTQSDRRNTKYQSQIKHIRGLEDRLGTDPAYPMIEVVTEYRRDKWITFSPKHSLILREIDNPYNHGKIPIAQLRYYSTQDDPLGESEVESVLPLWKAIQATVTAYMDEVMLKMRPPLKIIEGTARVETIEYSPEAQWLMSRPDAVTEMQSTGEAIRYFQTTYSALVSAFNTAMGDLSQGTSGVDPFQPEKTATEVRQSAKQQNVRDMKNQTDLSEFIKDVMSMWLSNNKQFMFSDPKRKEYLLKIVGKQNYEKFTRAGMDAMEVRPEAMQMIQDIIDQNPDMDDQELMEMMEAAATPKFPVYENPEEKDPTKLIVKPKLKLEETEDAGELTILPEDLEGNFDYIPDVKSMSTSASEQMMFARQQAIERLTTNQIVLQLLAEEGYKPKIKELVSDDLEDSGLRDADRYFDRYEQQVLPQAGNQQMGGPTPPQQTNGVPGVSQTDIATGVQQQVAKPRGISNTKGIPQGVR